MIGTMLVVGASRGVGLAVAEHFAPRVNCLITASRTPSPLGEWIAADVAEAGGIARVAERVSDGVLDARVYAGGTWEAGAFTAAYSFEDGPEEDTGRVIAINLVAPVQLVRRLLPALRRAANPRVILVGALSGLDNRASREVANSASKYGLRGAAHALRLEVPDIPVTVINPGNLATAEVEADITEGRFGQQVPIPLSDLLAVMECALTLSPAAVATEINLVQVRGSR